MTGHRASFLGLLGLVSAVFVAASSCNLDSSGFGETGEELCSEQIHCDDGNICTDDACGADGVCAHEPAPDGLFPDGVQGNCKVLECKAGVRGEAAFPEDVDDGNPCTEDSCDEGTATHQVITGATCEIQGGLSTCNAQGECEVPECGHLGADGEEVQCPTSDNDCTLSYCDKAKGKCVEEKLDGVPVPGSVAPTECGGQYCVNGSPMGVEAPADSPCALGDGSPGRCSPEGACVECYLKSHCDTGIPESPCHSFGCSANSECFEITQPDGPLAAQTPGDCRLQVCSAGLYDNQADNTDVPVDNDDCTQDLCVDGNPDNPPSPLNSPCGAGGLLYCDGMGACKGCTSDAQCLGATDCKTPYCDLANDECADMYAPMGTVVSAQTAGDCKTVVCDGNGNFAFTYAAADPENDANDCTTDTCVAMDMTSHTPVMKGSTCDDGGGVVCDAVAHCVGAPCSGPAQCPNGTSCVDGVCCESMCGGTCNACSSVKKGGGQNGLCGPIMTGDPDGNDCPGNSGCSAGVCLPLAQGAPCQGAVGECATGFCADGYCCNSACNTTCQACNLSGMFGTCGNVPNLSDPANECANGACNGAGQCKLDNGQACAMGSQCLSGNCVDGVCCNTACGATCQACNVSGSLGTCTNVPNGQDPASECANGACNGGGQCKLDNGQPCGTGGDCLSSNCPMPEGVCCNTACGATCQACSAAKTGGANGTCANVSNMTDPDNECVGTTVCSAGACNKLPNGSPCTQNAECNSNICNGDGVCCNAACSGTCQSCALAGSTGTCTNIASGQDPDMECAGTQVCNGSGACRRVNGDTCGANGDCLSGFCVDGVCCGTTCNGTCQACNLGGSVGTCTNIMSGQDPANECAGTQVCNGSGQCRKAIGDTCVASSECLLGNCVDGRCCNGTCDGPCQACNLTGSLGMCGFVTNGQDPANECPGTTTCNGAGACTQLPLGAACGGNSECMSGFCVDGACCSTSACAGTCMSCNPAETVGGVAGACDEIDAGTDPDDECTGGDCNGAGACEAPLGTGCTLDSQCQSGFCVDGVCCDTACDQGCRACSAAGVCTLHPLNSDPEDDCTGAQVCGLMGNCVVAPNGTPCPANDGANCASTVCVDGFCCGAACDGECQACNLSGVEGTCTFIPATTDPQDDCPGMQVCDGNGQCVTP